MVNKKKKITAGFFLSFYCVYNSQGKRKKKKKLKKQRIRKPFPRNGVSRPFRPQITGSTEMAELTIPQGPGNFFSLIYIYMYIRKSFAT